MDKGLTVPKWVLIVWQNTTNATEFICPICLPTPKSSGFHWASVVCVWCLFFKIEKNSTALMNCFLKKTKSYFK